MPQRIVSLVASALAVATSVLVVAHSGSRTGQQPPPESQKLPAIVARHS
jgi:hypothetical protein